VLAVFAFRKQVLNVIWDYCVCGQPLMTSHHASIRKKSPHCIHRRSLHPITCYEHSLCVIAFVSSFVLFTDYTEPLDKYEASSLSTGSERMSQTILVVIKYTECYFPVVPSTPERKTMSKENQKQE
jgi:hypothetical protein